MGVRNLLNRKARTVLTILGVLIGTAAIIVMMSLGVGMNEANMRAVEQLGNVDVINVSSYYYRPPDDNGVSYSSEGILNDEVIAQIGGFDEVMAVTPLLQRSYNVVAGKFKANWCSVIGVDPSAMDVFFELKDGRLLNETDTNVAVFGYRMPYNFYNTRSNSREAYWGGNDMSGDPIVDIFNDSFIMTSDWSYGEKKQPGMDSGSAAKPKLNRFTGIGLLNGNENIWSEYDNGIIVNIAWLNKIVAEDEKRQNSGSGGGGYAVYSSYGGMGVSVSSSGSQTGTQYNNALVKVYDRRDVEAVMKKINDLGLGANSPLEMLQYMESTTNQIQQLLGWIAAVSLLVAAIGIANTMVMSVYERTKEIAVMKVLGCRLGNIGMLFLFEAGLIGFIGGIVGIGFSELAAYILNNYGGDLLNSFGGRGWNVGQDMPPVSIIPMWLIGLGLVFSTIIGIISGFLPARRAMRLSVLQAIHN
jgi:ABC-type antimicrobial peptide transport system permease subunit